MPQRSTSSPFAQTSAFNQEAPEVRDAPSPRLVVELSKVAALRTRVADCLESAIRNLAEGETDLAFGDLLDAQDHLDQLLNP